MAPHHPPARRAGLGRLPAAGAGRSRTRASLAARGAVRSVPRPRGPPVNEAHAEGPPGRPEAVSPGPARRPGAAARGWGEAPPRQPASEAPLLAARGRRARHSRECRTHIMSMRRSRPTHRDRAAARGWVPGHVEEARGPRPPHAGPPPHGASAPRAARAPAARRTAARGQRRCHRRPGGRHGGPGTGTTRSGWLRSERAESRAASRGGCAPTALGRGARPRGRAGRGVRAAGPRGPAGSSEPAPAPPPVPAARRQAAARANGRRGRGAGRGGAT